MNVLLAGDLNAEQVMQYQSQQSLPVEQSVFILAKLVISLNNLVREVYIGSVSVPPSPVLS